VTTLCIVCALQKAKDTSASLKIYRTANWKMQIANPKMQTRRCKLANEKMQIRLQAELQTSNANSKVQTGKCQKSPG
jgi:hypothetical protein